MMEGLSVTIKRMVSLGLFSSFNVGLIELVISHLQYEDDHFFCRDAVVDY